MSKTKCSNCRYWSEMLAQSIGCGPIEAVCLAPDGPKRLKFTPSFYYCQSWRQNLFGAVDAPPGNLAEQYEALDAQAAP